MVDALQLLDDLKFALAEYEMSPDRDHWQRLRAAIAAVIDDVPYEVGCGCSLGGDE